MCFYLNAGKTLLFLKLLKKIHNGLLRKVINKMQTPLVCRSVSPSIWLCCIPGRVESGRWFGAVVWIFFCVSAQSKWSKSFLENSKPSTVHAPIRMALSAHQSVCSQIPFVELSDCMFLVRKLLNVAQLLVTIRFAIFFFPHMNTHLSMEATKLLKPELPSAFSNGR